MWRQLLRRASGPVGLILAGSVIGQGSVLLVSPLLTRLYSPRDFGAFAVVTAVAAILGAVITLSWDRAIVIPEDDGVARQLMVLAVGSAAVLSSVLAVIAYVFRDVAARAFDSEVLVTYWWMTPATVFFVGLFVVMSSWLVRERRYSGLAMRNGVQGTAQAVSSVSLGVMGLTPFGLISSILVGRIAGLVGMFGYTKRAMFPSRVNGDLRAVARRYKKFPLISTWSRLLNSMGLQVPALLIIALYGSLEAGLFALTVRVLAAPVGIVADAVSQYFEGTLAHGVRSRTPRLAVLTGRVTLNLAAVAVVPAAVVIALGPVLFAAVFGAAWEGAGEVARYMMVAYFAQFVVAPISRSLLVLERQGALLAWDASRLTASTAAVVCPFALGLPFVYSVAILASVHALSYAAMLLLCLRAAKAKDRELVALGRGHDERTRPRKP